MKLFSAGLVFLAAVFLFTSPHEVSFANDFAEGGRIHHKFKLLPGKGGDRFVLYFPFQVTEPGRIRVYLELKALTEVRKSIPSIWLVDARVFGKIDEATWIKWCQTLVDYHPTLNLMEEGLKIILEAARDILDKEERPAWYHAGHSIYKREPLIYDVDAAELRKTGGKYLVLLRNPSGAEYHGNVLISYPGNRWDVDPQLEAAYERKPDLAIEKIELDPDNRVVVTLSNRGPGWMHAVRYNTDGQPVVRFSLELDGKEVESVPLAQIDPKKTLVSKNTRVDYRTNLLLNAPGWVTALIDADGIVAEPDKGNNKLRVRLTPRTAATPPTEPGKRVKRGSEAESTQGQGSGQVQLGGTPDLAIGEIFLDQRKRIVVKVLNLGAGLDTGLYQADARILMHLSMNGRSWAYVPLAQIDPAGALKNAGGSAAWTSDFVVRQEVEITAVIDEENRLAESNKANNTLTRRLGP
jgi:hypothetical protein